MEVIALTFLFIFSLVFLTLGYHFKSNTIIFMSGVMLILFSYIMLQSGITEPRLNSKSVHYTFDNIINTTTNITYVNAISMSGNYTYVRMKDSYTDSFGTICLIAGILISLDGLMRFGNIALVGQ